MAEDGRYTIESTDSEEEQQAALGIAEPEEPATSEEPAEEAAEEEAVEADEESETDDDAPGESEEDGEQRPKSRYQRRIRKLSKKSNELAEQLAEKDRELQRLRQQYEERQEEPEPQTTKPQQIGEKPHEDSFNTNAEYVEALAEWKVEQRLQAERQRYADQQRQEQAAKAQEVWQSKLTSAQETYEDFTEVVNSPPQGSVPTDPLMREIMTTSEVGGHMVYHLSKDPSRCQEIFKMSAAQKAAAMAQLESEISSGLTATEGAAPPKLVNAPKPAAKPMTRPSGTAAPRGEPNWDDPNVPLSEWRKYMKKVNPDA